MNFAEVPRPAFGRAAQHLPACPSPLKGKALVRHRLAAKKATELVPELPAPGEHVHCLMTGFYDLAQVVCDVAKRTSPRRLRIATLCWNRRNVVDLVALMEARRADPLPLTLLASGFFKRHNKDVVEWAAEQFAPHPARLAFAESHCKVVCFDLGDDDGLVFEGSANLRTNRSREQLTVIRDRQTHDWHAAWIDELVKADGRG